LNWMVGCMAWLSDFPLLNTASQSIFYFDCLESKSFNSMT